MSAPMTTYALLIPGSGFATSFVKNASHLPWMDDTSRLVRLTMSSMRDDFPKVPTMMAVLVEPYAVESVELDGTVELELEVELDGCDDEVTFVSVGLTPVTDWMSVAKSNAAR